MGDGERIELGTYPLGEGKAFRLSAQVRLTPEQGQLVVAIYAAPADQPDGSALTDDERARYSMWLARIGDRPWVAVDHAQGLSTIAERDGEPYLYWHGKAPGTHLFT